MKRKRKLFCEYNPLFYKISLFKENLKKDISDFFKPYNIAKEYSYTNLDNIWASHMSIVCRKLEGVDMQLQKNKHKNLQLACKKIDGIIIKHGEVFSFWKTLGKTREKDGYKTGLVISKGEKTEGIGGGLCQMANLIHYLVLHTPLKVVEMHHHSDALFPDSKRRVPFGTGTSVSYKSVDYRFMNTETDDIQIRVWLDDEYLYGEIRSKNNMELKYRLAERNSNYKMENGIFYRNSEVYRIITNKTTKEKREELILKNHSKVLYDYSLIPKGEIAE